MKPGSKESYKDAAFAIIVVLFIVYYFTRDHKILLWALPVVLIAMTIPALFKPVAFLIFFISTILSSFMTKVLLTIIFFTIVSPISLIRKVFGRDSMQLKAFAKDTGSVMRKRDHTFTKVDLEKPF